MAKSAKKLTLSPSRDIPFDLLELSQANVRRIKAGVSIAELAEDIARRSLLSSLNVRPIVDGEGVETGRYEIPAGGRRFRALELLVAQKRLAKDAPIPCIVQQASGITAEEDSYAENTFREALHPLDQFRAMQTMVDNGDEVEAIAAHFMATPAVVRQRLKLASVSPKLHEVYAEDGMTLDQLMAFTVTDDRERQEQVFEMLAHSHNRSAAFIRQRLTENTVRTYDKRVRFVGVEAYTQAGGAIARDLFEPDDGGWLTDPALLDRLVSEKLTSDGERIGAEGWKWVTTAIELPWSATSGMREIAGTEVEMTEAEKAQLAALETEAEELEAAWSEAPEVPDDVTKRIEEIETAIGVLAERPMVFDAEEMGLAGAFVSIEYDGTLSVERGYVRPEDEPVAEGEEMDEDRENGEGDGDGTSVEAGTANSNEDDDGGVLKPIPDRLVADLTAWRTLALEDAVALRPDIAFIAVLHAMTLACFYFASRESCLQLTMYKVSFNNEPAGLRDSTPGQSIASRHELWRERLPKEDSGLWDALLAFGEDDRMDLLAHCTSLVVNAQAEVVGKYDNGRISPHHIERRLEHSHILARAVDLDLVAAGWRPNKDDYFGNVTKPRILADVTEAKGEEFANMIAHLKKPDMAREAAVFLENTGWLPECLRTPGLEPANDEGDYAIAAE